MDILAEAPRKGYRLCVGIALFSPGGQVFLGKRATRGVVPSYSWQMPQGGIDAGEDALAAAKRELYEETSAQAVEFIGEVEGWLHYDLPKDVANWRGRYKGQAQRWFAFRHLGDDDAINVTHPPDGHTAEFSRWRWEALEAVPAVVVPFKRAVYERVAQEFAPLAGPQDLRAAARRAI